MKIRSALIAFIALVSTVSLALAAEYYLVQDQSGRCMVKAEMPTAKTKMILVGAGKAYATQAEGVAAMKASAACKK